MEFGAENLFVKKKCLFRVARKIKISAYSCHGGFLKLLPDRLLGLKVML
jgi:hypothetical protein